MRQKNVHPVVTLPASQTMWSRISRRMRIDKRTPNPKSGVIAKTCVGLPKR
jgi:hypothetical protein